MLWALFCPDRFTDWSQGSGAKFEIDAVSPESVSSSSPKITYLIKALDEVLDENGGSEISKLFGDGALHQCRDLQNSLRGHKSSTNGIDITAAPATSIKAQEGPNIPKTMTPVSISPWKSSQIPRELPGLPAILDKTLEQAAFTHTNAGSGKITDLTYERLEWVGDIYLELTATLLISQTFPHLTPGKSSQMRETLVKNITLAEYARTYGFDKRANLGPNFEIKDQQKMAKIMGDMFEAYVAAIVLSDPENGVTRAAEWLKTLWGQTLRKKIIEEEKSNVNIQNPMWRLVGEAREAVAQKVPLNPKEQLQKAIGCRGVKVEYKDIGTEKKDKTNKLPLFTVGVYLTGHGESGKLLGRGSANGKKDAGMKAAEEALRNKKLIAEYMKRKKEQDEQVELERQALAQAQSS